MAAGTTETFILIKAIDRATAPLRKITNNFLKFRAGAIQAQRAFDISAKISMASQAVGRFASAARGAVASTVSPYEDFEHAMARVQAMTGATTLNFEALWKEARRLGSSIGEFTALDVAGTMVELGIAGRKTNEIISSMPTNLDLATAAGTDLSTTVATMTGIMGAYGIKAKESAMVGDILTAAFTNSKTTLNSLGEAISYSGGVAADAKIGFKDLVLMTALLGDASIDASSAGTGLNNVIGRLAGASRGPGKKALAEMGIQLKHTVDGVERLRPTLDILSDLRTGLDKLGPVARKVRLFEVFGREGQRSAVALMKALGTEKFDSIKEAIDGATGALAKKAAVMRDTAKGATLEMNSALGELQLTIGEKLSPALTNIKDTIGSIARSLAGWANEHPGLTKAIAFTAAGVAVLATALTGILILAATLTSTMGVLAIAFGSAATGTQILGGALGWLRITLLTKAIPAVKLFTASLLVNPIFLIIAAVAALAAAAYLIYANWAPISAWFLSTWNAIDTYLTGFWERFRKASLMAKIVIVGVLAAIALPLLALLGPFVLLGAAAGVVIAKWEPISSFFEGLWDEVGTELKRLIDNAYRWIDGFKSKVVSIVDAIKRIVPDWLITAHAMPAKILIGMPAEAGIAAAKGWGSAASEAWGVATGSPVEDIGASEKTQVGGSVGIRFENAPSGMQVSELDSYGGIDLDVDAGMSMVTP